MICKNGLNMTTRRVLIIDDEYDIRAVAELSLKALGGWQLARLLCTIIPASCPFEREIKLRSRTILYILPLCKLNPFYEQLVELRFKALTYLAQECGEDITLYC
jgi:hypothetical protein